MKTGTSVDHYNRARCYIRIIAFVFKCLTKSTSVGDNIFQIQRSNHVGTSHTMSRHIPSGIFTHFQALNLKAH